MSAVARLSLALLILPVGASARQGPVADSIRHQAQRFIGALASRDIDQFVNLFTTDPDFIYVDGGRIYPDRAALRAAGAGFFRRLKTFNGTWNPSKVVVTGPDGGAFTGVLNVTAADTSGAVVWPNGKIWTLVYQRRGGQWWIVQAHEATVPPPRAAPAARPDTLRLEVGAREVNGQVYQPHAARVRVRTGPGDGALRGEWVNVLTVGDSAGRKVHRWVTTGTQFSPAGDTTLRWELRQTYDATTLAPYGIVRTNNAGLVSALRIDGRRVHGTRKVNRDAPVEPLDYQIDRPGFVASASDLVPLAVGFKPGRVIIVPIWGPPMTASETRVFTVIDKTDVNVEGTVVNAWKVEEHRQADGKLVATWWLLDKSPYMVYGEVPLADGSIQRMSEVEVPMPR